MIAHLTHEQGHYCVTITMGLVQLSRRLFKTAENALNVVAQHENAVIQHHATWKEKVVTS